MSRTSRLIPDVLSVLAEMRALNRGQPIADLRTEATIAVANRDGRLRTTIHDALARRLGLTAQQFDELVGDWLHDRPARLKGVLESRAADSSDRQRLNEFFADSSWPAGIVVAPKRLRRPRRIRQISVILDEDVAVVFTNDKAVNDALRDLINIGHRVAKRMQQLS